MDTVRAELIILSNVLIVAAVLLTALLLKRRYPAPPANETAAAKQARQARAAAQHPWVTRLIPLSRRWVFALAIIWALILYAIAAVRYPTTEAGLAFLMKGYGLTALALLFLVFVPGLVRVYFPWSPYKVLLLQARRALGLSMLGFALIHATLGFFDNLSGSVGALAYLAGRHQVAVIAAVTALAIFLIMASTSFDRLEARLGKNWKRLHRLIYIAGLAVLLHVLLIGSNFTNTATWLTVLVQSVAFDILLLEIIATLIEIRRRGNDGKLGWQLLAVLLVVVGIIAPFIMLYSLTRDPYDPHAEHRVILQQQAEELRGPL